MAQVVDNRIVYRCKNQGNDGRDQHTGDPVSYTHLASLIKFSVVGDEGLGDKSQERPLVEDSGTVIQLSLIHISSA